jgi:ribulose 1,5-bisphosphate carboxylase large subunit-like protein
MICIKGSLEYEPNSALPSEDQVYVVMQQIVHDAVYGTFSDLPPYWDFKWEYQPDDLAHVVKVEAEEGAAHIFAFEIAITPDIAPLEQGGLQHLIGALAGDLFSLSLPQHNPNRIRVEEVILPESMRDAANYLFRTNRAHTIADLRRAFHLQPQEPLLAFSFKPRMGLKYDVLEYVTLEVLRSGFHLVELDTRNLMVRPDDVRRLLVLAQQAVKVGGQQRVTRFSPNLSVPAPLAIDIVQQFLKEQPDPVVIKVDGSLDGISTCQAIRRAFQTDILSMDKTIAGKTPIITCYPLLRQQLQNRISPDLFVDALVLSGVDIIYPGGRPSLGTGGRTLDADSRGRINNAARRYDQLVERGWPMLTVAGGIYAGELHAFYELLGPNVAYFLGGAVALHKDGPVEGAKLCVRVIKEAIERRERAGRTKHVERLNDRLIVQIEDAYAQSANLPTEQYRYVEPRTLFAQGQHQPWFLRHH